MEAETGKERAPRNNRHWTDSELIVLLHTLVEKKGTEADAAKLIDRSPAAVHTKIKRLEANPGQCPAAAQPLFKRYQEMWPPSPTIADQDRRAKGPSREEVFRQYNSIRGMQEEILNLLRQVAHVMEIILAARLVRGDKPASVLAEVLGPDVRNRIGFLAQKLRDASDRLPLGEPGPTPRADPPDSGEGG